MSYLLQEKRSTSLKCNIEIFNNITPQIYILEAEALTKNMAATVIKDISSDSDKEIHRILENKH